MSVWNLIWSQTESRYRELERAQLQQALDSRPFGIVTLGDGTLMDVASRQRVLDTCHLVALELDLANCYWRLKTRPNADMDFWHPLHAGPLQRFEQVKPFHEARWPGMHEAPHQIPIRGLDKGAVVTTLRNLLDRLTGGPDGSASEPQRA